MSWLQLARVNEGRGRRAKGALLLGLFLCVLAMATSATLHKVVHPNATQPDHSCAATMLASGQVDAAATVATSPEIPLVPVVASLFEVSSPSVASFNLPLSRGPPALLS